MQTAGNFISATAELTACMKHCKYNSYSRNAHLWLYTDRDTSAIILYSDNISWQN